MRTLAGVCVMGVLLPVGSETLQADTGAAPPPRCEVGGQVTTQQLREFAFVDAAHEIGWGGRFTVNLTRAIATETQVDYFPNDGRFPGRGKVQTLFGVRAGARGERFGVFGKVRPGFVRVQQGRHVIPLCAMPEYWTCPSYVATQDQTWLAFDMGGVFEFYPGRRMAIRFDMGDTLLRGRQADETSHGYSFTTHNLRVSSGAAVRF